MELNYMKQENKDLLLRDLCARLSYGVKLWHESFEDVIILHAIDATHCSVEISIDSSDSGTSWWNSIEQVKPYLFPLSSMTKEQEKEFYKLFEEGITEYKNETKQWLKTKKASKTKRPITIAYVMVHELVVDWLNKNHFDYRGLIPKGLAVDCTNLNIY